MPPTICIAHLSDLHVAWPPRWGQLNLKRWLGRLNWLLNRRSKHSDLVVEAAARALVARKIDAVVVTGDLGQIGIPEEFSKAARLLAPLTHAGVPVYWTNGNHDRYGNDPVVDAAFDEIRQTLWLDRPPAANGVVSLGPLALLLLDQIDRVTLLGSGSKLGTERLVQIDATLASCQATHTLVAGHYPLVTHHGRALPAACGLADHDTLLSLLQRHNVGHYLCGHIHLAFTAELAPGLTQHCAGSTTVLNRATVFSCTPESINIETVSFK